MKYARCSVCNPLLVPVHPELQTTLLNMLAFGGLRRGRLVKADRTAAWQLVKAAAAKAVENRDIGPERHIGTRTVRHTTQRGKALAVVWCPSQQGWHMARPREPADDSCPSGDSARRVGQHGGNPVNNGEVLKSLMTHP